jgi:hypothetical protein
MRLGGMCAAFAALALAACGQGGDAPAGASSQQASALASCESPAAPIAIGASVAGEITQTAQHPANARYYCFAVPEGTGAVTVTLSGMATDLDLYIGSNGLQSVQGVNVQEGETYEWKANAFGTGDEIITINNPRAGTYYAEIVSYQGEPSAFTLAVR